MKARAMNTYPATALFTRFQAACDYVDQHTSPANAGSLMIERRGCFWAVCLLTPTKTT